MNIADDNTVFARVARGHLYSDPQRDLPRRAAQAQSRKSSGVRMQDLANSSRAAGRIEPLARRGAGRLIRCLSSASVLVLVAGGAAMAQTAGTAASSPGAPTVDEVVVTVRQRSENLQNTPLSVAAVTQDLIEKMNVQSTMDLDNKIPGLVLRPDNNRLQPFIAIRGVGDISRNPGIDNRTGLYLDGIPLGRSSSVNYPIFDVESIEVLRGPQGTLFGNNSLTGIVSITSQKPQLEDSARATVSAGSRNLFSGSAYVNAALGDNLAARVTVAGRSQDGFYKNRYNNATLGGGENFAGRVQLRYTPSDATTIDISADAVRAKDDVLLGVGQYSTGPQVGLPNFVVNHNVPPNRDKTIYGGSVVVEHTLPGDFVLTSLSSYRRSRDNITYDGDGSPLSLLAVNFKYTDRAFSQELRIASPENELFDYVVGAFYYHQKPGEVENIRAGPDFPTVAARGSVIAGGGTVKSDQAAVFAHGTVRPVAWLALDAGIRYQHTSKSALKIQEATALALGYPAFRGRLKLDEGNIEPLVSVTFKPFERVNFYALYSTGRRAGGFNMDVLTQLSVLDFDSESVKNYEVGMKSQLFDNRLRLNISAYSEVFKNFQQAQNIIDPNPAPGTLPRVISVISNAAKAKSEGVEIDFQAAIFEGLRLTGGLGFNRAYYDSFVDGGGPGVDFTGNRLIEAPRFQGSLVIDYERQLTSRLDGNIAINYAYRSHVYSQPSNNRAPFFDERYRETGYGSVGARVAVVDRERDLEVAVFARNLFDETHIDGAAPNAAGFLIRQLSEPRTLGVELTIRR